MHNTRIQDSRSKKKILQITALPFPPEIRVVKEGISLQEAGFDSAVICPPNAANKLSKENWEGITVFRPPVLEGILKPYDKLLMQTSYMSYYWLKALKQVIADYKPDVLHVHDIWLAKTAFLARTNQKVIIDLHENMPAAVVEYLRGYRGLFKIFNQIFKSGRRVARFEKALLKKSDGIFVVVEEARQRVLQAYPTLCQTKVVNIENLESQRFITQVSTSEMVIDKSHFSLLYIGGFGPHRGIETLISAMKYIKDWKLKVRLYLIGAHDNPYVAGLKELIHTLDVGEYIIIKGWVPALNVLHYIQQADVGTVPHYSNPHTNNTIPHKLFQYMMTGTPVLVSSSPPLARTVKQAHAGEIFLAGDELDCAHKIRKLCENPELTKIYARDGLDYVLNQGHNWEEESAPKLISFYDQLLVNHESST